MVLQWIEQFSQTNGSFKILIEQTLDQLRMMLLNRFGIESTEIDSSFLTSKQIIYLIKLLTEAYQNLRLTPIESLPLELAIVEYFANKDKH